MFPEGFFSSVEIEGPMALVASGFTRQSGVNVAVVIFDTWPPLQTVVGGYDFLGGEVEAILLVCRGLGKDEFAAKELCMG